MIEFRMEANCLTVRCESNALRPRHRSQLTFWGFREAVEDSVFILDDPDVKSVVPKLAGFFQKEGLDYNVDQILGDALENERAQRDLLNSAVERAATLKAGELDKEVTKQFLAFLSKEVPRALKEHQIKAALHLLASRNGANFSVPGSGKTAVVLAVFSHLRLLDEVDALFVVGPPACFAPWQDEYFVTLGKRPTCQIMAGGDVDARRSRYLVTRDTVCDLYLTSFQTLQNDWPHVRTLFHRQGVRFMLVVDEAHYIKQIGGVWAEAVLNVAREATRSCVLTGTPFPRSFSDAFNLFDVLWPTASPICTQDRYRVESFVQKKNYAAAVDILDATIGPLFYRVRKSDLGLAPQVFHEPIQVPMNRYEREVYDGIVDRIGAASMSDFVKNFDLLVKLRRGRMIRLRQCVSNVALLSTAVTEYQENLVHNDLTLADVISHYDDLEHPAKLGAAITLVKATLDRGDKIVVWSNFVGTLNLLVKHLRRLGCDVGLVYGGTPFERTAAADESTREHIIRSFCDPESDMHVLVANPAACAESISLHKVCSSALYYDLSYNCAQYLQSLDRIHRVGGSEEKESHYYFLQYEDTVDADILNNVLTKSRSMSDVIDREYAIYSLDMFADDEELEAYERLFGSRSQ